MPILFFIGLIDFKGESHSILQNNWHEFAASVFDPDKLHFEAYQPNIGTRQWFICQCASKYNAQRK